MISRNISITDVNKTCTKEVYAKMKPSQLVVGLLLSNQKVGTGMGGGDNEMCCSLSAIYHLYWLHTHR